MKSLSLLVLFLFIQLNASSRIGPQSDSDVDKLLPIPESLKYGSIPKVKCLLTSGGAANPYRRSISALQIPFPGMYANETLQVRREIMDGLRYVLQTKNKYTFAYHGTGSTAINAVMDNLIVPGDVVAVGQTGYWSKVTADIAERFGAKVIRLKTPMGRALRLEEIENALSTHRPKVLHIFHGESTTGVLQNLEGVGDLCRKYKTLLSVDVVATVGQQPINMDARKIDVVLMNSQKGISGIVGLCPVSFSPRAIAAIKKRETLSRVYQWDVIEQAREWLIEEPKYYHTCLHSASAPLFYMLREALAKIVDEGIENVWKRHEQCNQYMYDRVAKMGLEFMVPEKAERLPGTLLAKCPKGKDAFKISDFMWDKYRIETSTGFGPETVGKCIRIGLFGQNAKMEVAKAVCDGLQAALSSPETNA